MGSFPWNGRPLSIHEHRSLGGRRRGFVMTAFFKSVWLCSIGLAAAIGAGGPAASAAPAGLVGPAASAFPNSPRPVGSCRSDRRPDLTRVSPIARRKASTSRPERPRRLAGRWPPSRRRARSRHSIFPCRRTIATRRRPVAAADLSRGGRGRARSARLAGLQDEPGRRRRLARGARSDPSVLRGARFRAGLGRRRHGLTPAGGFGAVPPRPRRTRTASIFPPSRCRTARSCRRVARAPRRGRNRRFRRRSSLTRCRRAALASCRCEFRPLISARPSVADPGRALGRGRRRRRSRRRARGFQPEAKGLSAICATN